jgi:hypothetical protein
MYSNHDQPPANLMTIEFVVIGVIVGMGIHFLIGGPALFEALGFFILFQCGSAFIMNDESEVFPLCTGTIMGIFLGGLLNVLGFAVQAYKP